MTTKLKVKVGTVEVDYEGDEHFSKEDVSTLISTLSKLQAQVPIHAATGDLNAKVLNQGAVKSTAMIAQKIGGGSGPELALAATAYLTIFAGKQTVTRKEILTEMQTAKTLYKKTYSNNLGSSLKGLCRASKLNEVGSEVYSLHEDAQQDITNSLK